MNSRDTREGIFVKHISLNVIVVIYKVFCLDVAQGNMNGALNETQTHLCRFSMTGVWPNNDIAVLWLSHQGNTFHDTTDMML